MALTKSTELQLDESNPKIAEELLMNTDLGTVRVPRYAIPNMANLLVFVTDADTPLRLSEEEHDRRFLNINNSVADINIIVPDANNIRQNVEGNASRFGGLFCELVVSSLTNDVLFTPDVPGQIRGLSPTREQITSDTLYVGLNRRLGDEAVIRLYKRGGLWDAECNAGWRTEPDAQLDKAITITAEQDRQIVDADNGVPVWLTDPAPGTLTVQADIATGVQTTIVNDSAVIVPINVGGHTLIGDSSIPANQAASFLVGPVVAGDNKRIFIAASS